LRTTEYGQIILRNRGSITSASWLGLSVKWQQYQNVGEGTSVGATHVTSQNVWHDLTAADLPFQFGTVAVYDDLALR
jgi:hypothetical protein